MIPIKSQDIIQSVTNALQFISYYHPKDFLDAMFVAYQKETNISAKNAITQILINSKLAASNKRPMCQDTGSVIIFAKVGMNIQFEGDLTLQEMMNQATLNAYTDINNPLRASMVAPAFGIRKNTLNNTPAILHTEIVLGNTLELFIAAKGAGSENKARFAILNPADNIEDWLIEQIQNLGAGWCPPGVIGLGIGGSPEMTLLLAKESLLQPINIHQLIDKQSNNSLLTAEEKLRLNLYQKINDCKIGAQGLGGDTTVLDVKLKTYPTHAASLPIALIPNCAANRHIHITLDGSGVAQLTPPDLNDYPTIKLIKDKYKKIHTDDLLAFKNLQIGETVLLSGKILTARDAAHKQIKNILDKGELLSDYGVNLRNKLIYYVGPVKPTKNEIVGPAGPTTASRMDRYTTMMLQQGISGMIGKSERNQATVDLIKQHQSIYFIAVGGAAYLISQAIKKAKIVAFPELGMEAIHEFEIKDMPITVAVDSSGNTIHKIIQ